MTRLCPIRLLVLFFSVLVAARFAAAQGGPPLITDDPGTPGNKHWEINVAFTDTKFHSGTIYELPHIDLNYGYGDNVQLKLEGPFTIFNGQGEDYASLGYTDWGVKWRFQEENKSRPTLSTYPQITFVGNQGFAKLGVTDPGTDFYLPLEVMKTFGNLQLDVETGVLFRQFTQTELSSGICGEYDLNKRFSLLGEVHAVTLMPFIQDEVVWNLGFKQDFSEHESLLFSAGQGIGPLRNDNPSFITYIGLQFRI